LRQHIFVKCPTCGFMCSGQNLGGGGEGGAEKQRESEQTRASKLARERERASERGRGTEWERERASAVQVSRCSKKTQARCSERAVQGPGESDGPQNGLDKG